MDRDVAVTPDKKKSAVVGIVLSLFGLFLFMYGTTIFPSASQQGHMFSSMLLIVFGGLLSVSSLLVFVLPAAYEYLRASMQE